MDIKLTRGGMNAKQLDDMQYVYASARLKLGVYASFVRAAAVLGCAPVDVARELRFPEPVVRRCEDRQAVLRAYLDAITYDPSLVCALPAYARASTRDDDELAAGRAALSLSALGSDVLVIGTPTHTQDGENCSQAQRRVALPRLQLNRRTVMVASVDSLTADNLAHRLNYILSDVRREQASVEYLINTTPMSEARNRITEANIRLMMVAEGLQAAVKSLRAAVKVLP